MELQNISNYDAVCNGNDYMKHVTTVFDMTISGVQKDAAMEFNRILGLDLLQKNADDMQSFSETVVYWGNSWWGFATTSKRLPGNENYWLFKRETKTRDDLYYEFGKHYWTVSLKETSEGVFRYHLSSATINIPQKAVDAAIEFASQHNMPVELSGFRFGMAQWLYIQAA